MTKTMPDLQAPEQLFHNEPFTDFALSESASQMRQALNNVKEQLGHEYAILIGHREVRAARTFASVNPSRPSEIIGLLHDAGPEHIALAVKAAERGLVKWRRVPLAKRVSILRKIASLLRKRKFELCAWLVFEIGKNWVEADAEIAEAIDFAEFYALQAEELADTNTPLQLAGEKNVLRQIPLGLGAVIAPWNFPCAIVAGMILAPVVAGNAVILKPSPNAPVVAAKFLEVLLDAGIPAGVVNFCPSSSATIGPALVEHPEIRFIVFTGSKEAGLDINLRAAMPRVGQKWIKRTILEMGGKDAIIVDEDADLDSAVDGIVQSAYGFSGQKCSACSRAIVDTKIYERFLKQIRDHVSKITVGKPEENAFMGPVVSERQFNRILEYIDIGKKEGRVVAGGRRRQNQENGYFIEPTVIADVAPAARIAQEEIFGPVLAVIRSRSFRHALSIANSTEFGLTGAVYTKSEKNLELAREAFHVGNLYFNRKCTGAMVGAHPFGGFNMSGTDSKAGGPDYLRLFTQAKTISEKVIALR